MFLQEIEDNTNALIGFVLGHRDRHGQGVHLPSKPRNGLAGPDQLVLFDVDSHAQGLALILEGFQPVYQQDFVILCGPQRAIGVEYSEVVDKGCDF